MFSGIVKFVKESSELNQRIILAIIMLLVFGVPLLLGGALFVMLLLVLAVFATSEYVTISQQPRVSILFCIVLEFLLVYLLYESNAGLQKIFLLAFIIAMFDTIAFFTGKAIGKHKLCPSISPGKTIEGFVGGIIGVMVSSVPFYAILSVKTSLTFYVGIVGLLAILSQVGDILESAFKRKCGVKDSSQLLPGHGGILDRFDGYILTVPVFFVINTFVNLF
ncbi:MAG: phosphatidate cytidylyltransferase [Proteobacteria bacterium]|jgi:phosphatidate cytidylyltransferase|nr:phosphatidate cytidylyltransferase [Pseudomonadota bacterium]